MVCISSPCGNLLDDMMRKRCILLTVEKWVITSCRPSFDPANEHRASRTLVLWAPPCWAEMIRDWLSWRDTPFSPLLSKWFVTNEALWLFLLQAATSADATLLPSVVCANLSFGFVVLFTSITQTYCTAELWTVINSPIMAFIYLTCRLMWALLLMCHFAGL